MYMYMYMYIRIMCVTSFVEDKCSIREAVHVAREYNIAAPIIADHNIDKVLSGIGDTVYSHNVQNYVYT